MKQIPPLSQDALVRRMARIARRWCGLTACHRRTKPVFDTASLTPFIERTLEKMKGKLDQETRADYTEAILYCITQDGVGAPLITRANPLIMAKDYQHRLAEMRGRGIAKATFKAARQTLAHFGIVAVTHAEFTAHYRVLQLALIRLEALQGARSAPRPTPAPTAPAKRRVGK